MKYKKIVIIIIILIIVGISFIFYGFNLSQNTLPAYNYKIQKRTDYEVLLKSNDFYEEKRLPSGNYYASNSINAYIINFIYNFTSDEKANVDYKYFITANLVGVFKSTDNQDKEVWNRRFDLTNTKKENKQDSKEFSINEQVTIDYDFYNNLARLYEETYGIVIDANLIVRMNVISSVSTAMLINEEKIEDYIELEIPITNTVSEVKENYEKETFKTINPVIQTFKNNYFIIGIIIIIIAILIIAINIYKYKKIISETYKYKLKKIFNNYNDIIATVSNKPNMNNLNIMNITIFDDLIDIASQTQNIIMYYENSNKSLSEFFVIDNSLIYIYALKA